MTKLYIRNLWGIEDVNNIPMSWAGGMHLVDQLDNRLTLYRTATTEELINLKLKPMMDGWTGLHGGIKQTCINCGTIGDKYLCVYVEHLPKKAMYVFKAKLDEELVLTKELPQYKMIERSIK